MPPSTWRRHVRRLFLSAALALLAVLGPSASTVQSARPSADSPSFDSPQARTALAQESERHEQRRARRREPEAKEERKRSRTAYRRASRREARDLARRTFTGAFTAPLLGGIRLRSGERVKRYLSDYWAEVDLGADRPDAMVRSFVPMRAEDDSGEKKPVDLSLIDRGSHFEQKNAISPARIPKRARSKVVLSGSGLRVGFAGAGGEPADGELSADRVHYHEVAQDTDFAVVPTVTGIETMWVLRSSEAPQDLKLELDLPAGARLQRAPSGGVSGPALPDARSAIEVVREGRVLSRIQPPAAADADGEPIPVSVGIEGDDLSFHVAHRDGDFRAPYLVDPVVEDFMRWTSRGGGTGVWGHDPSLGFDGWQASQGNCGATNCGTVNTVVGPDWWGYGRGLYIYGRQGDYYTANRYGLWAFAAPEEAFIWRTDWGWVKHDPANSYPPLFTSAVFEGLISTSLGRYEPQCVGEPGEPCVNSAPFITSSYLNYNFRTGCNPRFQCWPGTPDDPAGTNGNMMVFGLVTPQAGTARIAPLAFMGGAQVSLEDFTKPSFMEQYTTHTDLPSGWVEHASPRVAVVGLDKGLGMRRIDLFSPAGWSGPSSPSTTCNGSKAKRSPCPPTHGANLSYDAERMPEGIVPIQGRAYDISGNVGLSAPWNINVDRSAPTLSLSGDLWDQRLDSRPHLDIEEGGDLYPLAIDARDGVEGGGPATRRSGIRDVAIYIDGVEEDRIDSDETCADSCAVRDDFVFDADWVNEGTHTIRIVARDKLGHTTEKSFSIRVVRDNFYADQLDSWRADTERAVDAKIPAVPLTGPMPIPPADWRRESECEASTSALRSCYDSARQWGSNVATWLRQNLPGGVGAEGLPDPPVFDYSHGDDTTRDLTRRTRDAFALARKNVANPLGNLSLALTFHEPVTPAQLADVVPMGAVQSRSVLTGVFDPGGADWQGQVRVPLPSTLSASVEDFYAKQSDIAAETISEFEQEIPEDSEDVEDLQDALNEARAFKSQLDARQAFLSGITVELDATAALNLLRLQDSPLVKTITPLPGATEVSRAGADALGRVSANASTVSYAEADVDAEPDGGTSRARAAPRFPTCAQRGQARADARAKRRLIDPHPYLWAPSRHKADSVLGAEDGDHHMKIHRLRFRYQDADGLRWLCAARRGERGVELEARVYPEQPSEDDPRWSDNWESNSVSKYTQTNMPGRLHQDDLASAHVGVFPPDANPTDKQYYPDFAIISRDTRAFRYRRRYVVNFTTNEGQTDDGDERVIYSGQATTRPKGLKENGYCFGRGKNYESCMFARVAVCFNHSRIGSAPASRRIDWLEAVGKRPGSSLNQGPSVSLWKRPRPLDETSGGLEVNLNCDPAPPGAGRP